MEAIAWAASERIPSPWEPVNRWCGIRLWGVAYVNNLGIPDGRWWILLSPGAMFSITLPRLQGGRSLVLTQSTAHFSTIQPAICLCSLRFNIIQGESGYLIKTIPYWDNSSSRNHPHLSMKAVSLVVCTLTHFFWTLHTAGLNWLKATIVSGLS